MSAHGKQYRNARAAFDREQEYSPVEAITLLKDMQTAKFDETVEVHFRLGLNVRHADEQLRGTLMLPHGTGREAKVAVFAEGDKAREAQEAGADIVGAADLAKKVEDGFTEFDVAIATPDQMGNVGKLGRILGPRGLMPNPKTGTVTMDVAKAVRDAKAGKLEYRTDRGANVHVSIGKKSFDARQLVENYAALVDEIVRAKPAAAKGRYIRQITLTSTMGPGIHVDPQKTRGIVDELEEQAAAVPAYQRPSPETGSGRKAEAFPRRIGEPRFPPPFSEPAVCGLELFEEVSR
jgi:large subunit ribosomal protein L1